MTVWIAGAQCQGRQHSGQEEHKAKRVHQQLKDDPVCKCTAATRMPACKRCMLRRNQVRQMLHSGRLSAKTIFGQSECVAMREWGTLERIIYPDEEL